MFKSHHHDVTLCETSLTPKEHTYNHALYIVHLNLATERSVIARIWIKHDRGLDPIFSPTFHFHSRRALQRKWEKSAFEKNLSFSRVNTVVNTIIKQSWPSNLPNRQLSKHCHTFINP